MIRLVILILASIIDILVIIGLLGGSKYNDIVESMNGSPLYKFYTVGFFVVDIKILHLKNKLLYKLKTQTALIYGEKYAEYYAYTALAQAVSFIMLIMGFALTVSVFLDSTAMLFVAFIGLIACAAVWNFCILSINDTMTERREVALYEFPDMVIKFALLVNSGMVLREAWHLVANTKDNSFYKLMKESCENMRNGMSDIEAIHLFGVKTDCQEVRKFTSSLVQGIEKGNAELSSFLVQQSQEMLTHKRQTMLQKGEQAAGKLIIPIGITFVGVILIIGVAAMQSMSF